MRADRRGGDLNACAALATSSSSAAFTAPVSAAMRGEALLEQIQNPIDGVLCPGLTHGTLEARQVDAGDGGRSGWAASPESSTAPKSSCALKGFGT